MVTRVRKVHNSAAGYYLPEYFKKCNKELSIAGAKWKHRAEHNDFIWAECSNCGFMEEAWKVVKLGKSSREYVGVRWNFCPMCGKSMGV